MLRMCHGGGGRNPRNNTWNPQKHTENTNVLVGFGRAQVVLGVPFFTVKSLASRAQHRRRSARPGQSVSR